MISQRLGLKTTHSFAHGVTYKKGSLISGKSMRTCEWLIARFFPTAPSAVRPQIWICPFGRDDLLEIWAQSVDASSSTEVEKHALKLLTTYYGPYQVQRFPVFFRCTSGL